MGGLKGTVEHKAVVVGELQLAVSELVFPTTQEVASSCQQTQVSLLQLRTPAPLILQEVAATCR